MIEQNAALKGLQAKLARQKMALTQLVDSKRQNGAESRQADVEDAVREIVASEIESHDEGNETIGC